MSNKKSQMVPYRHRQKLMEEILMKYLIKNKIFEKPIPQGKMFERISEDGDKLPFSSFAFRYNLRLDPLKSKDRNKIMKDQNKTMLYIRKQMCSWRESHTLSSSYCMKPMPDLPPISKT